MDTLGRRNVGPTPKERVMASEKKDPAICMWCYVKHEPKECPERTDHERFWDKALVAFDMFRRVKKRAVGMEEE